MRELRIDLAALAHLSPVALYLHIVTALHEADFHFEELVDLFPAPLDLAQPYTVDYDGQAVIYRQPAK